MRATVASAVELCLACSSGSFLVERDRIGALGVSVWDPGKFGRFEGLIDTCKFVTQWFSSYHQGEGPAPFRVLVVKLIDLGFAFQNKLIE